MSNILDAIEFTDATGNSGDSDSDNGDARDNARSPTSPRKPRQFSNPARSSRPADKQIVEHAFQVITPQRTFKLCAPSEEEEIKWLAALRALINRERGLSSPTAVTSPATSIAPPSLGAQLPIIQHQPPTPSQHSEGAPGIGPTTPMSEESHASSFAPAFSIPVRQASPLQQQQQQQQQSHINRQQQQHPAPFWSQLSSDRKISPSSSPAPIDTTVSSTSRHNRTRSATQSAKAAVADVVRRFNPDASG